MAGSCGQVTGFASGQPVPMPRQGYTHFGMDGLWPVIGVLVGLVVGGFFVFALLRRRWQMAEQEVAQARAEAQSRHVELTAAQTRLEAVTELQNRLAAAEERAERLATESADWQAQAKGLESRYDEQAKALEEQRLALEGAKEALADTFKALSADALKAAQDEMVKSADRLLQQHKEASEGELDARRTAINNMLQPLRDQLESLDKANQTMEQNRAGAYSSLSEQLKQLSEHQGALVTETGRLIRALQDPGTAGSWGEMVLERVLEMAGIEEHFSYETQQTSSDEDGRQRPDVLVRLPGQRTIVIDSKAPMRAYLDAHEAISPSEAETLLMAHANKLNEHVKVLAKRDYAKRDDTLDFTVMFVPSEAAFRAAVEKRPGIIEDAMAQKVFLATPTTLLALLKSVAYGWRQEKFAQEAVKLQSTGRELYESLVTLLEHYENLGKSLKQVANHYNKFGGSLETRVLPRARKFKESGLASNKEMPEITPVEFMPRAVTSSQADPLPLFSESEDA